MRHLYDFFQIRFLELEDILSNTSLYASRLSKIYFLQRFEGVF